MELKPASRDTLLVNTIKTVLSLIKSPSYYEYWLQVLTQIVQRWVWTLKLLRGNSKLFALLSWIEGASCSTGVTSHFDLWPLRPLRFLISGSLSHLVLRHQLPNIGGRPFGRFYRPVVEISVKWPETEEQVGVPSNSWNGRSFCWLNCLPLYGHGQLTSLMALVFPLHPEMRQVSLTTAVASDVFALPCLLNYVIIGLLYFTISAQLSFTLPVQFRILIVLVFFSRIKPISTWTYWIRYRRIIPAGTCW